MLKNYPKISIVTVSYNQGQFIEDNIKSVIEQDYPNIEHIIIDAGSTDGTLEILKKYDKHLNWVSEPDKGQSDGLNKGFKKATGDIIGWFNSDDRVPTNALKYVSDFFIKNPEKIAVVGDQRLIDEHGEELRVTKSRAYTYDFLLNHARGITQNSTFFKRSVFDKIGYLNEDIHFAMDRDLFIRISKIRDMPYIPKILGEFRIQEDAKTALGSYYFAKDMLKIRRKYKGEFFSSGNKNDIYLVITEPLRRVKWLRRFVQKLKGVN